MAESVSLIKTLLKSLTALVMACLILNSPLSATGNPVPGRWQKVVAVEPGTKIIVYTRDGTRLECRYQSIIDESMARVKGDDFRLAGDRVWTGYAEDSDAGVFASLNRDGLLVCDDLSGKEQQVELINVEKIILPKSGEYAREWAAWGAMGGAIAGTLVSVTTFDDFTPTGHLLSACAGAGLGAIFGSISGTASGSPGETIYISKEKALQEMGK